MVSIEELNLEIPEENHNNEASSMLGSNLSEINNMQILKKGKKKKKKKKKNGSQQQLQQIDSKNSSVSPKKKSPYDYSPLTKTIDKMPTYIVSAEVLQLQAEQTKIFNNFFIKPNMELSPDEYNDLIIPVQRKPGFFRRMFCCENKLKLTKWFLDGDNISLTGDTYKRVKHKDLSEFEEQAIYRKLIKMYRAAPKLENLTITAVTDFEMNVMLEVIAKLLNSSTQFDTIKQLRVSSLPYENLLWVGPQFAHTHFVMPAYNLVPKINPWVEIRHMFRKYIDKGASKEEIVQLINFSLKKFEKNTDLQLLHLKFSSWSELGDETVRAASNLVWKLGFQLRELILHFCGRKLTDFGIIEICDTIIGMKSKKLIALGFGFDSRNLEITDNGLKKISETLLIVSERAYLRSVSVFVVSQSITDYGLWCLGQSLQRISERLNNLVVLLGSIEGITDKGVQNVIEGVLKCGKNLRSISIGFLSWEIYKYGLRIIESNILNNNLNLELFNLYYSNQGFLSKEREEMLKIKLAEMQKGVLDPEIHIFLR